MFRLVRQMRYHAFSNVFSERDVRYMLSPVRLFSVVCLSVTLVHPTQPVEIFGNFFYAIWYLGHPWTSAENFYGDRLRRSPFGGVKRKRGSQI